MGENHFNSEREYLYGQAGPEIFYLWRVPLILCFLQRTVIHCLIRNSVIKGFRLKKLPDRDTGR